MPEKTDPKAEPEEEELSEAEEDSPEEVQDPTEEDTEDPTVATVTKEKMKDDKAIGKAKDKATDQEDTDKKSLKLTTDSSNLDPELATTDTNKKRTEEEEKEGPEVTINPDLQITKDTKIGLLTTMMTGLSTEEEPTKGEKTEETVDLKEGTEGIVIDLYKIKRI